MAWICPPPAPTLAGHGNAPDRRFIGAPSSVHASSRARGSCCASAGTSGACQLALSTHVLVGPAVEVPLRLDAPGSEDAPTYPCMNLTLAMADQGSPRYTAACVLLERHVTSMSDGAACGQAEHTATSARLWFRS